MARYPTRAHEAFAHFSAVVSARFSGTDGTSAVQPELTFAQFFGFEERSDTVIHHRALECDTGTLEDLVFDRLRVRFVVAFGPASEGVARALPWDALVSKCETATALGRELDSCR